MDWAGLAHAAHMVGSGGRFPRGRGGVRRWSYLFSQQRELLASAVSLSVAAALTWALFAQAWRAGRGYAAGLAVYTGWMTLAASLSIGFAALN